MNIKQFFIAVLCLVISGCASQPQKLVQFDPNQELASIMTRYAISTEGPMNCAERFGSQIDCMTLLDELEQLMSTAPGNIKVMTVTGLLQYKLGRKLESQYTLDQILAIPQPAPEVALLRSRIALEHGNFTLVNRIVRNQLAMLPSYGALYEILALNHYLQGQYTQALAELEKSRALNNSWSTYYHYGLINQAMDELDVACVAYEQVLTMNVAHTLSKSRLKHLKLSDRCN